jgi:hypothetical protein
MLNRETPNGDPSFEKKWFATDNNDSRYAIWKKFIKDALPVLDNGDYEAVVGRLWDEDFQLPKMESPAHDQASFSQAMDTRKEIEYLENISGNHGHSPQQPRLSTQELKDELKIWNTRNLTIFLLEYLIDSEIRISNSEVTLEERVRKIETLYQHILKMLNVADYYVTEPAIFDFTYTTHPHKFNIDEELKEFTNLANQLLPLFSTKQFELLKMQTVIENSGIQLPRETAILDISSMSDEACQTQMDALNEAAKQEQQNSGGLRRSHRVLSGLNCKENETPVVNIQPAAPAPTNAVNKSESTLYRLNYKNIAFAALIIVGIAALMAGAITAVILLGGPTYLAFAAGTVAFLAGSAIVGGIMTAYQSYQQRQADNEAAEYDPFVMPTRNASMHRRLTNGERQTQVKDAAPDAAPSPTGITSPQPSASPLVQNQETIIAATRNASRR